MNEIEFLYIGWCHGKNTKTDWHGISTTVKNDKVWTAFKVQDTYYSGWGARGKALRFKKQDSLDELNKVIRRKEKEYNEVDAFQLFSIFPDFKADVAAKLLFAVLSAKII